jgi:2-polyprenyl-3-methyl-5-hydroxy-6-metoxy-1,4-benzoquinol methylase
MKCCVCDNEKIIKYYDSLFDDRYGYKGFFGLLKCESCGHKFLDVNFSNEEVEKLYTKFYPRSTFDINGYRPHKEQNGLFPWLQGVKSSAYSWVPKSVKILDIGCGYGESLGYHKNRGCEVYGVEADQNVKEIAEKYEFNLHIGVFSSDIFQKEFFDYITMDQVVEHLKDPIDIIKQVSKVIRKDGYLILSTPNANGFGAKVFEKKWINWHAPYHLQFFSRESIWIVAKKLGFEVEFFKTITNSEWIYYQLYHMLTYTEMGNPSDFWKGNMGEKSFKLKVLIKIVSCLHKLKLGHIITRVFDILGVGDNFVIILRRV